jgi:hypothetical protein
MSLGDQLGLAGLIVTFFGIVAFYLWPSMKWIGWLSLMAAIVLAVLWGVTEARSRLSHPSSKMEVWRAYPSKPPPLAFFHPSDLEYLYSAPKSTPVPEVKAEIAQIADGHFVGGADDNVILAVSISNRGEPTTVGGWDLHVYDKDGHEHKTRGIYLPKGHNNITAEIGGFTQYWSGDDDLAQKLATNQIGHNQTEVGILAYQVFGTPQVGKGFKLTLYCRDAAGRKYEAGHVIREDPPLNLHVPGLSKPF